MIGTARGFISQGNPTCAVAVALETDQARENPATLQVLEEAVQAASTPLLESGDSEPVLDVSFSHNGAFLATQHGDKAVTAWDADGNHLWTQQIVGKVRSIAFSPDDSFLTAATSNGTLQAWRVT